MDELRFCYKCALLVAGKFCPFCGKETAKNEKMCPHCDNKNALMDKFCRFCGRPIQEVKGGERNE